MLSTCSRENEVKDLVARGQWPQASPQELREHVRGCRGCSDLALVAGAFQSARAETVAAAHTVSSQFGSAGALWWRAQLRRRNAAVERIGRPLLGAQIFALAVSLLAAIGFAAFEAHHGIAWLDWLEDLPQSATLHLADLSSSGLLDSGWFWLVAVSVAATLALLAGAAMFLGTDKQ
jgi:hypothetical protein